MLASEEIYRSPSSDLISDYRIVLFCVKHSLSPSVRAGGYGTAGWAIGGDIIIDLSKLVEVEIEAPHPDGSFTSLRDMAPANSKGKKAITVPTSGKRRREDDAELRRYDLASHAVATFLRGPTLSSGLADLPSPSTRRRLDPGPVVTSGPAQGISRQDSNESDADSGTPLSDSTSSVSRSLSATSTFVTTPSPPSVNSLATDPSHSSSGRDPFGYLDSPSNFPPPPPIHAVQTSYTPQSTFRSWGASTSASLANPPAQLDLQGQGEPIYPHAFVSFGAGMRQKEIDTYTAQNRLEARYPDGAGEGIPYHVPL